MRFPAPLLVLTFNSSWTNTIGIGSAQSAPHHFFAVDHSANNILEQRLVCHSFSRLSHNCHTLSRWPWSSPLHRNSTSLGPQPPPRLESSRLHDLNHLTLRFLHRVDVHVSRSGFDVSVFVSIGCCTRHSTPATKLIPIRFNSFHILSLVNPFVPMSATFDSVETCFVANFFSSTPCCNHSHFTSM